MFILRVDHEIELQLLQPHHSEELFQLVDRNRYHLRKWLPWVDSISSSAQYNQIIYIWLQQFAEYSSLNLGIRYRNILVGCISLNYVDWANSQTSIGYFLGDEFQRKGIMIRAVHSLIRYVFTELKLNRIEIRCGEHNWKSRAIPERLGFIKEGMIRDGEKLNNRFHNLILYSMLAKEWTS
ncbi:GNAT family N-acetyltransferase [Bacillus massilinigeriensis]|uniref:GNAT family N-acetyltransferase n=1 Tax=Bacillus massilionigeriensis TaxID=1805475 RepID=UPI00096B5F64|nr:GNAT family protein [Bacillus massilionigeriensis]